jgi:hypothetical protein
VGHSHAGGRRGSCSTHVLIKQPYKGGSPHNPQPVRCGGDLVLLPTETHLFSHSTVALSYVRRNSCYGPLAETKDPSAANQRGGSPSCAGGTFAPFKELRWGVRVFPCLVGGGKQWKGPGSEPSFVTSNCHLIILRQAPLSLPLHLQCG